MGDNFKLDHHVMTTDIFFWESSKIICMPYDKLNREGHWKQLTATLVLALCALPGQNLGGTYPS